MNSPRRERPRELDRVAGWFGVVGASGRRGPAEGPVGKLVHRPLRVLLEPVVVPALRRVFLRTTHLRAWRGSSRLARVGLRRIRGGRSRCHRWKGRALPTTMLAG